MKASIFTYTLQFKQPSGTSRGILREKQSFFLKVDSAAHPHVGWGEVGVLRGLSVDDVPELEDQLSWTARNIGAGLEELYAANSKFPSIQFALEQAFSHLEHGFAHFQTPFSRGEQPIAINGLIWMGDRDFMHDQIEKRLAEGFKTLKMKVGAIDWDTERALLQGIRDRFPADVLELRVDANGAFTLDQALRVGDELARWSVHSIEQPIAPANRKDLAEVCGRMAVPVALDESLIGAFDAPSKKELLEAVKPQYIILKPSFIGGWKGSDEWIALADQHKIGWWATSALESTLGMSAIAQWAATKNLSIPQGLGTGSLYTNNIMGPTQVQNGELWMARSVQDSWDLSPIVHEIK